ncbi:uncharacterized protein LOC122249511 [Penaeus japonicus]|uniref:uncharacterized protein LOC122249511 n=1 Tax=Penaeus japonicus TaxID=27405 RepID=UPI001C70E154|nr:uncharacterized protein LOC122249511 [Penaeus japonicus]
MPPYGEEFRRFFKVSESNIFRKLADILLVGPSIIEGLVGAMEKRQSHMGGRRYLKQKIAESFTDANGESELYIGRESLFPGPSGWPIPHDAPYKHVLDRLFMAVIEAGLYEKWVEKMIDATRRESKEKQLQKQEQETDKTALIATNNNEKSLTIVHLQGPLILLLLGLIFSTFIFTLEVIAVAWCLPAQG